MTLYEIQYYENRPRSKWQYNRRTMLVMADNEEDALDYVQENAEQFEGFPWDHKSAQVVTEKEWHKA